MSSLLVATQVCTLHESLPLKIVPSLGSSLGKTFWSTDSSSQACCRVCLETSGSTARRQDEIWWRLQVADCCDLALGSGPLLTATLRLDLVPLRELPLQPFRYTSRCLDGDNISVCSRAKTRWPAIAYKHAIAASP